MALPIGMGQCGELGRLDPGSQQCVLGGSFWEGALVLVCLPAEVAAAACNSFF